MNASISNTDRSAVEAAIATSFALHTLTQPNQTSVDLSLSPGLSRCRLFSDLRRCCSKGPYFVQIFREYLCKGSATWWTSSNRRPQTTDCLPAITSSHNGPARSPASRPNLSVVGISLNAGLKKDSSEQNSFAPDSIGLPRNVAELVQVSVRSSPSSVRVNHRGREPKKRKIDDDLLPLRVSRQAPRSRICGYTFGQVS